MSYHLLFAKIKKVNLYIFELRINRTRISEARVESSLSLYFKLIFITFGVSVGYQVHA